VDGPPSSLPDPTANGSLKIIILLSFAKDLKKKKTKIKG